MNVSSLPYYFEELEDFLLKEIDIKLQVIGISESRIRKNLDLLTNMDMFFNSSKIVTFRRTPFYSFCSRSGITS